MTPTDLSAPSYGRGWVDVIHFRPIHLPADSSCCSRRAEGSTMNHPETPSAALRQIAAWLGDRRDAILAAWRRAVDADPDLTTASTTSRAQFVDHIPAVLDAFESRLAA